MLRVLLTAAGLLMVASLWAGENADPPKGAPPKVMVAVADKQHRRVALGNRGNINGSARISRSGRTRKRTSRR